MDICAESEYTLVIQLKILNRVVPSKAHAPKFSKPKDVGWFMILGSVEKWELIALKRHANTRYKTTSSNLAFNTPAKTSKIIHIVIKHEIISIKRTLHTPFLRSSV